MRDSSVDGLTSARRTPPAVTSGFLVAQHAGDADGALDHPPQQHIAGLAGELAHLGRAIHAGLGGQQLGIDVALLPSGWRHLEPPALTEWARIPCG